MPNYKRTFVQNAYIFLTITTHKRQPMLIKNINLLRESFRRAKEVYKFEIYAAVVLPDHLHLLILPENTEQYPKIIFAIKYHFSRNLEKIDFNLSQSKVKKGEKGIWQRRYFEHTIKDEEDVYNHLDYIHYNPVKHGVVKNVKNWEFSSFHKFARMGYYPLKWGTMEDIRKITQMDKE